MHKRGPLRSISWLVFVALLLGVVPLTTAIAARRPRYALDLSVDWPSGRYEGSLDLLVHNEHEAPLTDLTFRLYPNDETIYTGATLQVTDVSQEGVPLEFLLGSDTTVLSTRLAECLPPQQTTSLTIRFHGVAGPSPATVPTASGYGLLSKSEHALVLTSFYPMLAVGSGSNGQPGAICGYGDALWSEASDYTVHVTADPGLAAAATGRLISNTPGDASQAWTFSAEAARDFALVLTTGLVESELQSESRTWRTWFHPDHAEAAQRTLTRAAEATSLFSDRIGPLPYDDIEFVEVPLQRAAGVEFTGLILLSTAYTPRPFDPFFDILVSHEVAHQWFYAAVGNDPLSDAWLDEGPAVYLSNLFLRHVGRAEIAESESDRWSRAYSWAQETDPEETIASSTCAFSSSQTYVRYVYDGAALFLESVARTMGEAAFFDALSAYYMAHVGEIGSATALLHEFSAASADDLSTVFSSFGLSPNQP